MHAFGIIGMVFGIIALAKAARAMRKIANLEAELKRRGAIEPGFNSEN